jgi:hypothetical protein
MSHLTWHLFHAIDCIGRVPPPPTDVIHKTEARINECICIPGLWLQSTCFSSRRVIIDHDKCRFPLS